MNRRGFVGGIAAFFGGSLFSRKTFSAGNNDRQIKVGDWVQGSIEGEKDYCGITFPFGGYVSYVDHDHLIIRRRWTKDNLYLPYIDGEFHMFDALGRVCKVVKAQPPAIPYD